MIRWISKARDLIPWRFVAFDCYMCAWGDTYGIGKNRLEALRALIKKCIAERMLS